MIVWPIKLIIIESYELYIFSRGFCSLNLFLFNGHDYPDQSLIVSM